MYPSVHPGRLRRRSVVVWFALGVVLALSALTWPPTVKACSCVTPDVALESAGRDPGSSVFTATAGPRLGNDIPVAITRWFKGIPPAGAAVIRGQDPLDMCGPTSPPAGREYLFVTYTAEGSRLTISGCSPQVDVATAEGTAMLARAFELFGSGVAPPSESTAPEPTTVIDPSNQAVGATLAVLIFVLVAGLAAGLTLVALVLVLRRSRRGSA